MSSQQTVDKVMKDLEQRGYKETTAILSQNIKPIDTEKLLTKSMNQMSEEFTQRVGRPMTYSEMRAMWG